MRRALKGLRRSRLRQPQEEAGAIALLLREALEVPGKTAALVTPDRDLARRVAAELRRWQVDIDDSAGVPLNRTPPGVFLRLVLALAAEQWAPLPLLSVLKHPLAGCGLPAGAIRERVRALEKETLRGRAAEAGRRRLARIAETGMARAARSRRAHRDGDRAADAGAGERGDRSADRGRGAYRVLREPCCER